MVDNSKFVIRFYDFYCMSSVLSALPQPPEPLFRLLGLRLCSSPSSNDSLDHNSDSGVLGYRKYSRKWSSTHFVDVGRLESEYLGSIKKGTNQSRSVGNRKWNSSPFASINSGNPMYGSLGDDETKNHTNKLDHVEEAVNIPSRDRIPLLAGETKVKR